MSIKFTEKEYVFIEEKFDISKEDVDNLSEDELYDLQDSCSDIEVDAIDEAGDEELPEEGKLAASIVTKIGNALCEDEGGE